MKTAKVEIPNYLTVKHYLGFRAIEDITTDRDMVIHTVSIMTGHSVEEIRQWNINDLITVYKALAEVQSETKPEFYPILEVEGTLYGFQPLSKMNVGEHYDLEMLSKDPQKNMTEIIAILYRPIKEHKLKSLEFKVKSNIKAIVGGNEHLFPYYTVEKYDAYQRMIDKDKMLDFPASVALGAMSFFLLTGTTLLENSQISSRLNQSKKQIMKNLKMKASLLLSTTGGFTRYTSLQTLPSFKSQEISQFSI